MLCFASSVCFWGLYTSCSMIWQYLRVCLSVAPFCVTFFCLCTQSSRLSFSLPVVTPPMNVFSAYVAAWWHLGLRLHDPHLFSLVPGSSRLAFWAIAFCCSMCDHSRLTSIIRCSLKAQNNLCRAQPPSILQGRATAASHSVLASFTMAVVVTDSLCPRWRWSF